MMGGLENSERGRGLFDAWPDRYDQWFETPIGRLVRAYENELIIGLLKPRPGEIILDAGCGTGLFTTDILARGPRVVGLDISLPMLMRAAKKTLGYPFSPVSGDMMTLPFPEETFDKVVSVTALEFMEDAEGALKELFRVAKSGAYVVVATLNCLSPWANRRRDEVKEKPHSIFNRAVFRSPSEIRASAPVKGVIRTAIHFQKDDDPEEAKRMEWEGRRKGLDTGAFLAARWTRP